MWIILVLFIVVIVLIIGASLEAKHNRQRGIPTLSDLPIALKFIRHEEQLKRQALQERKDYERIKRVIK